MRRLAWIHLLSAALAMSAPAFAQELKPPKLKQFVKAVYPADKEAAGVTSHVVLSIEIGDDGKVGEVTVVTTGGADFDAAAIAAVKQFVFEPAESAGTPIPVKITYDYVFKIEEKMVSLGPQVNFEGVVLE